MDTLRPVLSVVAVLVCVVVWSMLSVAIARLARVDVRDVKQRTNPLFLTIAVGANLSLIAVVALLLDVFWHEPLRVLGFGMSSRDWVFVGGAIALTIAISLAFVGIMAAMRTIDVHWAARATGMLRASTLLGLATLFAAALLEEVVFRGYLAVSLARFGVVWALVLSALIFTFFHYLTTRASFAQTLDWFLAGAVFFYLYTLTGSIWVVALIHFGRNVVNTLVFNLAQDRSLLVYDRPLAPWQRSVQYVIALASWLALATVLYGVSQSLSF